MAEEGCAGKLAAGTQQGGTEHTGLKSNKGLGVAEITFKQQL